MEQLIGVLLGRPSLRYAEFFETCAHLVEICVRTILRRCLSNNSVYPSLGIVQFNEAVPYLGQRAMNGVRSFRGLRVSDEGSTVASLFRSQQPEVD